MSKKTTLIYTGLYGKTAAKTLNLLFRRWRTRYNMYGNNYSKSEQGLAFTGQYSNVVICDDGSVCIEVRSDALGGTWSSYYQPLIEKSAYAKGVDPNYIKSWLAAAMRHSLREQLLLDFGTEKLPDNSIVRLHSKSLTSPTSHIWEIKATADALESKDIKAIYGKTVADKVVGKAADPVRAEVNSVIEEESRRIRDEFTQKQNSVRNALNQKIADLRKQYRKDVANLGKQCRKAISDMKKEMLAA